MADPIPICRLCARPARDAHVCTPCTGAARAALQRIVTDLADDLDGALAGLAAAPSAGGGRAPAADPRLPIAPGVAAARDALYGVLSGWVRVLHEDIWARPRTRQPGPTCRRCRHGSCRTIITSAASTLPDPTIAACAAWLLPRLPRLRVAEYGPDAISEIADATARALRAIDLPTRRVALPIPCPTTVLDPDTGLPRPCGGALHAIVAPGLATHGQIRCEADRAHTTTGAEWEKRARRTARIRHHLTRNGA